MKKGSTGAAIFAGIFAGGIALLSDYVLPDVSIFIIAVIVGLSAIVGGLLGNKIFPEKQ